MSSFYRPSNKTTAKAASAKLTRAEREAQEESNLNILRASIERTLWSLDPKSELAAHLRKTEIEIRRHSLSSLLQEKKPPQVREDSPDDEDDDDDNALPDEIFVESSPLRRQLPRSKRNSARIIAKLPERRRPQPPTPLEQQILPSIEKTSSDQASEAITVASAVFDSPNKENSATTAATSVVEAGEETKPEFKTPAKKRAAEEEYEPSPVAKRVKTWLNTLTGGYMD
ncbi:hypothetical protein ACLX1H_004920 [Fusarium chlamydosporum]